METADLCGEGGKDSDKFYNVLNFLHQKVNNTTQQKTYKTRISEN